MAARQWTPEQRKQQSLMIRQWQPWKNSTGAKTVEGKIVSARNAYKGGMTQQVKLLSKELNILLREQKHLIEAIF